MGKLVLVPTPIHEALPLEPIALELLKLEALKEEVLILVEEHKVGRQRWLSWGLPREAIEKFIVFNEHTHKEVTKEIIEKLKSPKGTAYLLSDCGLPAFCDPGQNLVDLCHKNHIQVTATPFPNSIALAIALSGFSHDRFMFCGFVPQKNPERVEWLKKEWKRPETLILMETPYRLKKFLEELNELGANREIFLGMDLGAPTECLVRGKASWLLNHPETQGKREFVMVVSPLK
jgi:16S rRNA (cytidine1402-2'-O)-methyltransferase